MFRRSASRLLLQGRSLMQGQTSMIPASPPNGTLVRLFTSKRQIVREILEDGRVYEGEWLDDKPNGRGKEVWPGMSPYFISCVALLSNLNCTLVIL